jgi:hypothetical protein
LDLLKGFQKYKTYVFPMDPPFVVDSNFEKTTNRLSKSMIIVDFPRKILVGG